MGVNQSEGEKLLDMVVLAEHSSQGVKKDMLMWW